MTPTETFEREMRAALIRRVVSVRVRRRHRLRWRKVMIGRRWF